MNISSTRNSSIHSEEEWEYIVKPFFVISIHMLNYLLGLPLNSYVMVLLLHGCRRLDPCDVFTLNQAAVEIFFLFLGPFHIMCDVKMDLCFYDVIGFFVGVGMLVRSLFQCWVCLERYVAVIHPITFLMFRPLRYRVVICVVTWTSGLACGVVCMFMFPFLPYRVILAYAVIVLSIHVFSCMSILYKLRHPGPGERNADRATEDRAKKRAFHIVVINLLTFLVQNTPFSVVFCMQDTLSMMDFSLALAISLAINIMMGFMNPVFVLLKAGKLSFLKSACF
ncbi:C-C chemokine receptor type 5-like [Ictalurus punctatus]|uniref:C-C chemokine receptor type 5-like n=1 Tax=Ictalurus punctatus TaxID=7998 RepID=A0A2D0S0U6_ICTPU|nr:C-C chemokine receptor type 5-like [Ictalurus punctatus]